MWNVVGGSVYNNQILCVGLEKCTNCIRVLV